MRLIDADALLEEARYHANSVKEQGFANVYNGISIVCGEIIDAPTIDAVPTSELHELKNEMYENDGITMSNVAKLNALISKYANGEPVQGIRHGHWIYEQHRWICSECHENPTFGMGYVQSERNLYDFCPHCGAIMDATDTDVHTREDCES